MKSKIEINDFMIKIQTYSSKIIVKFKHEQFKADYKF